MESGSTRSEIVLGVLVTAALCALVWLTFAVGGGAPRGAKRYTLVFDSALGLSVDNTVAVAGVKIGVVDEIRVQGRVAHVVVAVSPDIAVRADAKGAVRQKTLLGEKYVDLDPGTEPAAVLDDGATLSNNVPTVEIDTVIRDVSALVDRLNAIAPPLEAAVTRLDEAMQKEDGKKLAGELVGALEDVRVVVKETGRFVRESGDDMHAVLSMARDKGPPLLDRIDRAAAHVDELLGVIDPKAIERAANQVQPAAENIGAMTEDMRAAMAELRGASKRLDVVLGRADTLMKRLDAVNESSIREFLQVQGVRVNLIPDQAVTTRIKKLKEESVPLPE